MAKLDIVQIKMDQYEPQPRAMTKALQIKVGTNKSVIVYNRINNYILEAILKAVFTDDH
ncbi:hypothetical protein NV391_12110 (plasmid) [Companilactobacillus crustorum]|uniref:hypothetical protein n=1 Tax=Companilactobacillus crustorum TaxID=392416 RepID=UPI00237D58F1|nr:hypothetical protein [Companilactobacillus crustorum]WDT66874.1 hypothetical protein NV391_12110 [Companilactobacillus crustorum]